MKATVLGLVLVGLATGSCSKAPATTDQPLLGHWRQTSEQIAAAEPGWRHAAPGAAPVAAEEGKAGATRQVDLYIDQQTMWTVSPDEPTRQEVYSTSNVDQQRGTLVLQVGPPGGAGTAAMVAFSEDRRQLRQTRTIASPAGTFNVTTAYTRVDDKTAP
ncbi:MAG: hypothetical protein WC815_10630 [Vicinamibacterales bacterium]